MAVPSLSDIKDLVSLAASVLKLGDGLYRASSALEEFKSKVTALERRYDYWQNLARKFGLLSEPTLWSLLQEAKEQLRREESRLKSLDGGCGFLSLYLLCRTDFPVQVGKSIVDLDNLISKTWNADDDAMGAVFEKFKAKSRARAYKFRFERDDRYVRIQLIEEALKTTLNSECRGNGAVRVALLYGRAGSGKSSMARNLALDYNEVATIRSANGSAGPIAHGCCQFDDVLYLYCGSKADTKNKQAELFRMVECQEWETFSKTQKGTHEDPEDPDMIRPMLEQLLKDRHSLLILDDVWEGEFLKNIVELCGEDMRILITSQNANLCEDSLIERTKSISMNQISREDSLQILKAHAGFRADDDVPEPVKECMIMLVEKVAGHPYALSALAVAIDKKHKTQLRQWKDAVREFDDLLNNSRGTKNMNSLHNVKYEWSVDEAIQMKFKRLGEEERLLLVLMVLLEGPIVAEEILQLFYGELTSLPNAKGLRSSSWFTLARKQLESLQCIGTHQCIGFPVVDLIHDTGDLKATFRSSEGAQGLYWSIHSLDRNFIRRRMDKDINKVLETVKCLPHKIQGLEAEPQMHATKLMGIFFESEWAKEIQPLEEELVKGFRLVRWEILPIIRLMAKNVEEGWGAIFQKSADQIFLSVMCKGIIHKDAAKKLLTSSLSKYHMWSQIVALGKVRLGITTLSVAGYKGHADLSLGRMWSIDEELVRLILQVFGHLEFSRDSSESASLNFEQCKALVVLLQTGFKNARSCIFEMRKLVLGLFNMLRCPPWPEGDISVVVLSYLVPLMHDRPFEYGREGAAVTPIIIKRLLMNYQNYDCGLLRVPQLPADDTAVPEGAAMVSVHRSIHSEAQALYDLVWDSNSDVRQQVINTGFHQLVNNLREGKNADGRSQTLAFQTLNCLAIDQFETGFDASKVQDLSICLAELMEHPERRKVSFELRAGFQIHVWDNDEDQIIRLLMRIHPARGNSMVLHSSDALGARGSELVRVGLYQDGLRDLREAQQRGLTYFRYLRDLVRARLLLEDPEGALKDCDLQEQYAGATKSSSWWSSFYELRSKAKSHMGNLPEALQDLNKSLHWNPENHPALVRRGRVKFLLGDKEGVEGDIKGVRGSHFSFGRALLKRMLGDLPGALEDLNDGLQLFPLDYVAVIERGYVKFLMGDKEGARADAEDERAEEDVREEAFQFGFNAKEDVFLFGFKALREAFRLGLEMNYIYDSTSLDYWSYFYQERGVLKRMMGDLNGALQDLEKGLQLRPNDYETLKQRGYVKFLMGDNDGARTDAKEALRVRPRPADTLGYDSGCLGTSIVAFLNYRL